MLIKQCCLTLALCGVVAVGYAAPATTDNSTLSNNTTTTTMPNGSSGAAQTVTGASATMPATMNTPAATAASQAKVPANGMLTPKQPMYTLHLNSNPTTGYAWYVVSYPSKYLKLTKHQYLAPAQNMPGAGGHELWQFQATPDAFVAPRVLKVVLVYARPWEINSETKAQTFYAVTSP